MDRSDRVSSYLAQNVLALRKARNWSQQQLAERAGIPRSTVTNIESGLGNPSLSNLAKLSGALALGVDELLARPRSEIHFLKSNEVHEIKKPGGVRIRKLMPERVRGLEIDNMLFSSNSSMRGTPHIAGTKEYITVIKGVIDVGVSGEKFHLERGDILAFPGDQPHGYSNPSSGESSAISIVIPL